jgi:hypothetical protein
MDNDGNSLTGIPVASQQLRGTGSARCVLGRESSWAQSHCSFAAASSVGRSCARILYGVFLSTFFNCIGGELYATHSKKVKAVL